MENSTSVVDFVSHNIVLEIIAINYIIVILKPLANDIKIIIQVHFVKEQSTNFLIFRHWDWNVER